MKGREGFTLAEVLVALLVLEMGALGVAAMMVHASRTLREARDLDWAVTKAEEVVDSLFLFGVTGEGERISEWGRVEWGPRGGGIGSLYLLTVYARSTESVPTLELRFLPSGTADDGGERWP